MNNLDSKAKETEDVLDLIATIDRLMDQGNKHVNVRCVEEETDISIEQAYRSCDMGSACCQPTEKLD